MPILRFDWFKSIYCFPNLKEIKKDDVKVWNTTKPMAVVLIITSDLQCKSRHFQEKF